MAMILCGECKQQVSSAADSCPHCGNPLKAKRGIFHYVFWGTVCFFITLAILSFGFLFLTAAGAGFLSGMSNVRKAQASTAAASTRLTRPADIVSNVPTMVESPPESKRRPKQLPPLTQEEIKIADALLSDSRIIDGADGTTWFYPKSDSGNTTKCFLVIGKKQTEKPILRWKIRYVGNFPRGARNFHFDFDEKPSDIVINADMTSSKSADGKSIATFELNANDHIATINRMILSKSCSIKSEEGVLVDSTLSDQSRSGMNDALMIYRRLGGVWGDD